MYPSGTLYLRWASLAICFDCSCWLRPGSSTVEADEPARARFLEKYATEVATVPQHRESPYRGHLQEHSLRII